MTSSSSTESRFKAFKFTAPSLNSSKPPPPPPKDTVYLQLRNASSRASLVPNQSQQQPPDSPLSPSIQYAIRRANSPAMNSSADFLSPSFQPPPQADSFYAINNASTSNANITTANGTSSSSSKQMAATTKKDKALAFLKFPKRSPRSPPIEQPVLIISNDEDPPPPQEDDGISLPWNFQHNIHVDEGYGGLPPSWSTSLAAAGVTEEEIAAIRARRGAGMRSPSDLRYLYTERPESPAGAAFGQTLPLSSTSQPPASGSSSVVSAPPQILRHPMPRTTSLPRLVVPQSISASNSTSSTTSQRPPLPTLFTSSSIPPSQSQLKGNNNPIQRVPPPKRKPPTPYEEGDIAGKEDKQATVRRHRPNTPSTSTSTDSHGPSSSQNHDAPQDQDPDQTTDTFAGLNNSFAYQYNPPASSGPPPPVPQIPLQAPKPAFSHPYANPANVNPSYSSPNLGSIVANRDRSGSQSQSLHQLQTQSRSQSRSGLARSTSDHEGEESSRGHGQEDLESENRLARNVNGRSPGPGTGPMSLAGGTSRFRVINGAGAESNGKDQEESEREDGQESKKQKSSLWGMPKLPKASKSQNQLVNTGASSSGHGHSNSIANSLSQGLSHSNLEAGSVSDHSHPSSSQLNHHILNGGPSTLGSIHTSAFTAAAASASSSIAQASSALAKQSSNLVDAMRVGVSRMRSKGDREKEKASGGGGLKGINIPSIGIRRKGKGKASDREDDKENSNVGGKKKKDRSRSKGRGGENGDETDAGAEADASSLMSSDEEFVSLPTEDDTTRFGGQGRDGGAPVWHIYSRPRAGTDASQRSVGKEGDDGSGHNTTNNASQYSLGVGSISARSRQVGVGYLPSASSNLIHESPSQSPGLGQVPRRLSLKSAASQGSLQSRLGGKAGKSAGSLHSHGHSRNGSVTSLNSIPEGERTTDQDHERPPMPEGAAAIVSRNNSTTSATRVRKKRMTMGAPPRLSLIPDSSDLSSWSEALLSGISLSGDGGLDLGSSFGLGGGEENENEKVEEKGQERHRRDDIESPGTAVVGTARPWEKSVPAATASITKTATTAPKTIASASIPASATPPPQVFTSPIPPPSTSAAPATRMRKTGQPLPTSKPPPSRPIPPIIIANPNGTPAMSAVAANNLRIERSKVLAAASAAAASITSTKARLELANNSSAIDNTTNTRSNPSGAAAEEPSTIARAIPITPVSANKPLPPVFPSRPLLESTANNARAPTTADGMLSPRLNDALSPAGSSAGPDSAQLWNEIEQMMDPGMISAIPGLHLSVALPPGAQDVLKSAGIPASSMPAEQHQLARLPPPLPLSVASSSHTRIVADIVGSSPPPAEYSAALTESFSATLPFSPEEERMEGMRMLRAGEGVLGTKNAYPVSQQRFSHEDFEDYSDEEEDYTQAYIHNNVKIFPLKPDENNASAPVDNSPVKSVKYLSVNSMEDDAVGRDPNRDSSRSSTSTLTVSALAGTTIVRNVSIARRVDAFVIDNKKGRGPAREGRHPPSPLDSNFGGSEESTGSGSGGVSGSSGESTTSSSQDQYLENPTPTTDDGGLNSPLYYYLDGHGQSPSPTPDKVGFPGNLGPPTRSQGKYLPQPQDEDEEEYEFEGFPDEETMEAAAHATAIAASSNTASRPTIVISDDLVSIPGSHPIEGLTTASVTSPSLLSPLHPQYRGWLSFAVQPLAPFIDSTISDPRLHYLDLREIAEGESGSVYAARLNLEHGAYRAIQEMLPLHVKERDEIARKEARDGDVWVAIKSVAIVPLPSASTAASVAATISSTKLRDLKHELTLLRGLHHDNILGMDAVYVDLTEDSLWVRMELMDRSLADIVALVGDGLQLQERVIARFTSDILCALDFLQKHNIAHRDVRSDNLLLNKDGVLKLADFSSAMQVEHKSPLCDDMAGVIYWQAPEVRRPPYDPLKIDVWSLGATVWEMAQQDPPFADTQGPTVIGPLGMKGERWPPLRQPELFSPAFHEFLRRCSEPAATRPGPAELLKSSLITNKACGRRVIVLLLQQCIAIEKLLQDGGA